MGNHFSLNYNCLQSTVSTDVVYNYITTNERNAVHLRPHNHNSFTDEPFLRSPFSSDNVSGDLASDKVTTQQQHCSCCCRCCLERRHCCVLLVYHASVWFDSSEIGIIIRSKLQLLFIKLKGWGWWCNEPRVIQT